MSLINKRIMKTIFLSIVVFMVFSMTKIIGIAEEKDRYLNNFKNENMNKSKYLIAIEKQFENQNYRKKLLENLPDYIELDYIYDVIFSDEKEIDYVQYIFLIYRIGSNDFVYPVINSTLTSPYGYRTHPIFKTIKFHSGIDLASSKGTKIYASRDGVVTLAGWNGGYGNCIKIEHEENYHTLYGHLDYGGLLVKVGDEVKKGELIGLMGSTGYSTGPHLHFEIIKDNLTQDPMEYLRWGEEMESLLRLI